MKNINTTFSDLLKSLYLNSDFKNYKEFYIYLMSFYDVEFISYSTFISYINGNSCPLNDIAKKILIPFNLNIDDHELENILITSKKLIKNLNENDKYLVRGVRISLADMGNINKVYLENLIKKRASELTEKGTFNAYVTDLIKKDLTKSGIL